MANAERGEVDLVVGENSYTLRMSMNAVAEIETFLDKGINEIVALVRDPADFRIGTWRVLLWGALREFHKVSIEDAGEIMGKAGVDLIVAKLGEAMAAAFPENEKGSGENPR